MNKEMISRPATDEEIKEIAFAIALWETIDELDDDGNDVSVSAKEVEEQTQILSQSLVTAIEAHGRVTFTVMWGHEPILGVFVKNEGGVSIIDSQLFLEA